jgi:hypothetical protein
MSRKLEGERYLLENYHLGDREEDGRHRVCTVQSSVSTTETLMLWTSHNIVLIRKLTIAQMDNKSPTSCESKGVLSFPQNPDIKSRLESSERSSQLQNLLLEDLF